MVVVAEAAMEEVAEAAMETDGMAAVEVAAPPGKDAEAVAAMGEVVIKRREEDSEEAMEGAAVAADGREEVALSLVLELSHGKRGSSRLVSRTSLVTVAPSLPSLRAIFSRMTQRRKHWFSSSPPMTISTLNSKVSGIIKPSKYSGKYKQKATRPSSMIRSTNAGGLS